jgi:quinol monooxygenase YgiN
VTRSQLHLTAKAGKRDELLRSVDELEMTIALREQPGFLAAAVLLPFDDEDGVIVEDSWSSPEHLERWTASPVRDRLLEELHHLLAQDPELRVYHVVDAVS